MSATVSNPSIQQLERGQVKLWIILIGVNHYQDTQIPDLRYCANDCKELTEALKIATQQFQETEIIALYDDGHKIPILSEITTSFQQFRGAKPEDTVLFYFSGHGYLDSNNRPILCVTDTILEDLAGTGLKLDILLNELRQCNAQRQLVWLDACQETEQQEDDRIEQNPTGQLLAVLELQAEQSQDFYAMLSCNKTERSWEIPELKHGLFTYCLIEGLRGKAANTEGKIDADSLFKYVERNSKKFIEYKKNPLNADGFSKGMLGSLKESSTKLKVKRLPVDASQTPQRIARGSGELIIGSAKSSTQRKALIVDELSDSEADISLCRILQAKGSFAVDYCFVREKQRQNIQQTIASYLQSESNQIVLLYLAGTIASTNSETYELVCDRENSINLNLLSQQLHDSPVKEIVIIANILDTSETNKSLVEILQPSQDKSLCLITTTTSSANNRKLLHQLVTVLETAGESEGEFWVSELITQLQKWCDFQPDINLKFWLSGSTEVMEILSVEVQRSHDEIFEIDVCPYKSLEAFTQDDAYFFHGREELIAEIIEKLQSTSFLAVVGASGSGKSSVVKAGVLPQLQKERLSDFESEQFQPCQSWVMLPGDNPIDALAKSLAPNNPDFLEGVLHLGVDSLVEWLNQQPTEISVLVIDQFEELFTPTAETDHINFLNLVLGVIQQTEDFFKVIITLRSDFLDECLGMSELAPLITKSQVLVPSCRLEDQQYCQIIAKPAQKVGLEVEDGLIALLLEELKEGSLPLLQYALEELWHKRNRGKFTVKDYQQYIGKLGKFLSNKAQETYDNLSEAQQKCAESIFLSLVFLVKEQEDSNKDTRRRLPISDLLVDKYKNVLDSTLQALINARLIVVSGEENNFSLVNKEQLNADNDQENQQINDLAGVDRENMNNKSKDKVTVEIAHEILLRDWETLKWWLDENREKYRLIREINQKAHDWNQNGKRDGFLLSKGALAKYEEFYVSYADELSRISNDFIDVSIKARDKAAKLAKRRQLQIIGGLTGGLVAISMVAGAALWQLRRATISEINALSNSAEALLESNQELDALVAGLRVGRKIEKSFLIDSKTRFKLTNLLQNILFRVKEFNRIKVDGGNLTFSPDGKIIAVQSGDGKIELWNRKGQLIYTLQGQNFIFSPDGKIIATLDKEDKKIKVWNIKGELLNSFQIYIKEDSYRWNFAFSSDGNKIAYTDNRNQIIKIWNLEGKLLGSFNSNEENDKVSSVHISPDFQRVVFGNKDGSIQIWNIKGDLLNTFQAYDNEFIVYTKFSPDKETLISASWDGKVKLWNFQGDLIQTFQAPVAETFAMKVSPNGKHIAAWTEIEAEGFQLWSVKRNSAQNLFEREGAVKNVTFSLDGGTIAFIAQGAIKIWHQFEHGPYSWVESLQDDAQDVEFSPDGKVLASLSDSTVKLWNIDKTKKSSKKLIKFGGEIIATVSYRDETLSRNETIIELWNLEGKLLKVFQGHTDSIENIEFSPDGKIIASTSNDNTIKLWNLEGELLYTLPHQNIPYPHIIKFSPNGKIIASEDDNGKVVKLWNFKGELLNILSHDGGIENIKFSPNGKIIVSIGRDKTVKIWNLEGELLGILSYKYNFNGVLFSPLGENIIVSSGGYIGNRWEREVKRWNIQGELLSTLPHKGSGDIEVSPDGKIIISSDETNLKLWNWKGKLLSTFPHKGRGDIEVSPDGKIIISSDGTNLKLWNLKGDLISSVPYTGYTRTIKFTPDSKFIISFDSDRDKTLKAWNIQLKAWNIQGELLSKFSYRGRSDNIQFSPDGKNIITINNEVKVWSLDLDKVMIRGCNWARDYLTNNPNLSEEDRKICNGIDTK
ncbi:MAG: caspase family protein [Microcoleaceae cyanobacterium]